MTTEPCFDATPVAISVESVTGNCPKGYAPGSVWGLTELAPAGWCPYLAHTVAGYVGCVRAGAGFGTTGGLGIQAQCPNPEVGVVISVTPAGGDAARVRVEGSRSVCPDFRLDAGMEWLADGTEFCLMAYDCLMPFINGVVAAAAWGDAGTSAVGCQGCGQGRVIFRIDTAQAARRD